uniref:Uncharacterized protein n=1 Tax=Panagrolaimus sp. JU765 TaxID=591449 RepID=A0AC34QWN8_9BILA
MSSTPVKHAKKENIPKEENSAEDGPDPAS